VALFCQALLHEGRDGWLHSLLLEFLVSWHDLRSASPLSSVIERVAYVKKILGWSISSNNVTSKPFSGTWVEKAGMGTGCGPVPEGMSLHKSASVSFLDEWRYSLNKLLVYLFIGNEV
jgi:hypothetical protein